MFKPLFFAAAAFSGFGCSPQGAVDSAIPVAITERGGRFELTRNGESFFVRGVGGTTDLELLSGFGANAIRTWNAEDKGKLLDEAQRLGIAVCLGIWLEHERHGFDYRDPERKAAQLARVERLVLEYKDHPALLMWGVGNEVEYGADLDIALESIQDAAAIVKRLDPHHPTLAVVTEIGDNKAARIAVECPSIDILGVNSYGGASSVPERLLEQGYAGAYMLTEFGSLGPWESPETQWGAPSEMTGHDKAEFYRQSYDGGVASAPDRCLGSFAFFWGHKQETTATWFGLRLESGETTEAVDVLSEKWTGKPVEQHAPRVGVLTLSGEPLDAISAGAEFQVAIDATDSDGDQLSFEWVIKEESQDRKQGGDAEAKAPIVASSVVSQSGNTATLRAPTTPGAYRVFVYVRDGTGRAGATNLPVMVK